MLVVNYIVARVDLAEEIDPVAAFFLRSLLLLRAVKLLLAQDRDPEHRICKTCRKRAVDYLSKTVVVSQTLFKLLVASAVMGNKINILIGLKERCEFFSAA